MHRVFRLIVGISFALSLGVGCQGGQHTQDLNAKVMRPPQKPPGYPASRPIPLDPELRNCPAGNH